MGNSLDYGQYFKSERVIDGINQVHVGVIAPDDFNPYSGQGIKIGHDGIIRRLENFIETPNCLRYEFEADTVLSLSKKDKQIIILLKEPETNIKIIKPMDMVCRQIYKPMSWGNLSTELDKIYDFVHLDESENNSEN